MPENFTTNLRLDYYLLSDIFSYNSYCFRQVQNTV